jgi:ABC-type transport system involved in cytochrome c biogenesis permease component
VVSHLIRWQGAVAVAITHHRWFVSRSSAVIVAPLTITLLRENVSKWAVVALNLRMTFHI